MPTPRLETLVSSESVIHASLEDEAFRSVIFSSEDKLGNYFDTEDYTATERIDSRAVREVGRKVLISEGLVPIGVGSERFALGSIKNGLIYKYAYKSKDPINDLRPEEYDYNLCKETFGNYVVSTYFDVVKVKDRDVLVSIQPWLDITKGNDKDYKDGSELQIQQEKIAEKSEKLLDKIGLVLDGGGVDIVRGNGLVLPDTSMVQQTRILGLPTEIIPERGERTWRSLGMEGSFMLSDTIKLVKN